MNSARILQNAKAAIIKQARAHPVYDQEQTEIRMAVSAAVRDGGSGRALPPEPPARLGNMDTQEYRRHVKEKYGFDAGV